MEYKIMRLVSKPNSIFLDLYNESLNISIELKFCFFGRKELFKSLINFIHYSAQMKSTVNPQKLIHDYEGIVFGNKRV